MTPNFSDTAHFSRFGSARGAPTPSRVPLHDARYAQEFRVQEAPYAGPTKIPVEPEPILSRKKGAA